MAHAKRREELYRGIIEPVESFGGVSPCDRETCEMESTETPGALLLISEIIWVTLFRTSPSTVGIIGISLSPIYHEESTIQFTRMQLNAVIRESQEHLLAEKEHLMSFLIVRWR